MGFSDFPQKSHTEIFIYLLCIIVSDNSHSITLPQHFSCVDQSWNLTHSLTETWFLPPPHCSLFNSRHEIESLLSLASGKFNWVNLLSNFLYLIFHKNIFFGLKIEVSFSSARFSRLFIFHFILAIDCQFMTLSFSACVCLSTFCFSVFFPSPSLRAVFHFLVDISPMIFIFIQHSTHSDQCQVGHEETKAKWKTMRTFYGTSHKYCTNEKRVF